MHPASVQDENILRQDEFLDSRNSEDERTSIKKFVKYLNEVTHYFKMY